MFMICNIVIALVSHIWEESCVRVGCVSEPLQVSSKGRSAAPSFGGSEEFEVEASKENFRASRDRWGTNVFFPKLFENRMVIDSHQIARELDKSNIEMKFVDIVCCC